VWGQIFQLIFGLMSLEEKMKEVVNLTILTNKILITNIDRKMIFFLNYYMVLV